MKRTLILTPDVVTAILASGVWSQSDLDSLLVTVKRHEARLKRRIRAIRARLRRAEDRSGLTPANPSHPHQPSGEVRLSHNPAS